MNTSEFTSIFLTLIGVVHLVVAGVILKRHGFRERVVSLLILYLVLSSFWTLGQGCSRLDQFASLADIVPPRALLYGLPLLSLLFLGLGRSFLRLRASGWGWWALGVAWIAAVVALNEDLVALPKLMQAGHGWGLEHRALPFGVMVVGWGVFMGAAALTTAQVYRQTQQPLHRNRIKYWSLALALTTAGAAMIFAGHESLGCGMHLLGTMSAVYAVLTYHLPDVRQVGRRTVSYLIVTPLTVIIYAAGFMVAQTLWQAVPGYSPLVVGAATGLVLVIFFDPLLGLVQRLVDRLISGTSYDPSHTVREYSTSISNILDLERLATVALGLIGATLGIRHGALFVVHYDGSEEGTESETGYFRLQDVMSMGGNSPPGMLRAGSPVAEFLRYEHQPLTQYAVDLHPRFAEMPPAERAWLTGLDMDVYVPIYAQGEWIGLLALGPKVSGDRYFEDDLTLLSTLADQTAVALENARLFNDLKDQNTRNEHLNEELISANQELARLDQAKSDFIDIASHELRTPLTQVRGYNEILCEMLENSALTPEAGLQMIQGVRKGVRRLGEIVDLMFDVSQLDTETMVMNPSQTPVALVVRMAADTWAKALEERKQTLKIDGLENLPPITADAKRLKQVLSHLIQNAVKYTPDGGHIRITGRLLHKGTSPQDQTIEIVVADTGIGIAPDDLGRIFDKFYRAGDVMSHSTGKTKFKGAGPGLGLTIAQGIVEAHGGRIWAESPGYDEQTCPGSQFHVILPVQPCRLEPTGLDALIAAVRFDADPVGVNA